MRPSGLVFFKRRWSNFFQALAYFFLDVCICALCGAVYEDNKAKNDSESSDFFETASLEKLRAVSKLLTDVTHFNPTITMMSNGQIFQSCFENFWGAKKIASNTAATESAIAYDGTLLLRSKNLEIFVNKIKSASISDMKMREVIRLSNIDECFLGIDINGKVIIYNPYKIFDLNPDKEADRDECVKRLKQIQSWPPMKYIDYYCKYGISEDGKVYSTDTENDYTKDWDNIDSIVFFYATAPKGYYWSGEVFYGLKTDGTLVFSGIKAAKNTLLSYAGKDISEYEGIVQITYMYTKDGWRPAILNNKGEFICDGRVVDTGVVAIGEHGYVKVNGSVYKRKKDLEYEKIEGLKLFNSIHTVEEEYEEAFHYRENLEIAIQNAKVNLKEKQEELRPIQEQYNSLGIFKAKEKKALKPFIDTLAEEIKGLEEELKKLIATSTAITNLKLINNNVNTQSTSSASTFYGNPYSAADLGAAARNAISGKKKEKSVIGSAVAGGIIAGPAGAVVGAIYAADKNNKKK